jgi:hypothetical protein
MGKFDDVVGEILFLCEKKRKRKTTTKSKVDKKSQSNRKARAENVKISEHESKNISTSGVIRHTAEASSKEKSESKIHKCRVDIVKTSGKVDDASCSCSDYQSRFRYYRNKEGVGAWDTITPIKSIFDPHTKEKPEIMNPDGVGYMCKHLIAFITYIDNDNKGT